MDGFAFGALLASALLASAPDGGEGPSAEALVEEALRCRPGLERTCATLEDALGAVESVLRHSTVLQVEPRGEQLVATVLRYEETPSEGALFAYVLDRQGRVLSRTCRSEPPPQNVSLSEVTRPPDFIREGEFIYRDRCADGSGFDMAAREWHVPVSEGRLGTARREESFTSAGESRSVLVEEPLVLPALPATVVEVRGNAGLLTEEGPFPPLLPGQRLPEDRDVLLEPGSRLVLEVGGLRVRIDSREVRLLLPSTRDRKLNAPWMQLARQLPPGEARELEWAAPYAVAGGRLFELTGVRPRVRCEHVEFVRPLPLWSRTQARTAVGPDAFYLAHGGRVDAYTCGGRKAPKR